MVNPTPSKRPSPKQLLKELTILIKAEKKPPTKSYITKLAKRSFKHHPLINGEERQPLKKTFASLEARRNEKVKKESLEKALKLNKAKTAGTI